MLMCSASMWSEKRNSCKRARMMLFMRLVLVFWVTYPSCIGTSGLCPQDVKPLASYNQLTRLLQNTEIMLKLPPYYVTTYIAHRRTHLVPDWVKVAGDSLSAVDDFTQLSTWVRQEDETKAVCCSHQIHFRQILGLNYCYTQEPLWLLEISHRARVQGCCLFCY